MSSEYKSKLTPEQQLILDELPRVPQAAFAAMALRKTGNETLCDSTDIGYSLNMAHSHTSILHQQADYWKNRAKSAEESQASEMMRRSRYQDALAEIEAMAPKGSEIEKIASAALELPVKSDTAGMGDSSFSITTP